MVDQKTFWLKKALKIALKSGCLRGKRGLVIVKNAKEIMKTFNLVMPINDACIKGGCLRDKLKLGLGKDPHVCRSIHAEARAVSEAAKKGISLEDGVAYITCAPCMNCAKLLYIAGIREVYFVDAHADETGTVLLNKMGVKCVRVEIKNDNPELRLRDIIGQ